MTTVAGSVTDRDLRPGQLFELREQSRLVGFHLDEQVRLAGGDLVGVTGLGVQGAAMNSTPARLPSTVSTASSSGANDVISLLLASTVTWASTISVVVSNADYRCAWRPSRVRVPRSVLPSMAITVRGRLGLPTSTEVRVRSQPARTPAEQGVVQTRQQPPDSAADRHSRG
ncbi:hypothetical protein [Micromonospora sp. KC723]|uniref:hypothetical protein n=1 Tax=Micromonospora sp. KC723 TaxID=2530381 RepID=UPI001FB80174|nr:hypothetical protein [Micromonospora sp. KC723]